jgi:hypothetical protein
MYNINPALFSYNDDTFILVDDRYDYPCEEAFNEVAGKWHKTLDKQEEALNNLYQALWAFAIDNQKINNPALPPARGFEPAGLLEIQAVIDLFSIVFQVLNAVINGVRERKIDQALEIMIQAILAPIAMLLAAALHLIVAPVKSLGRCMGLFKPVAQTIPVPVAQTIPVPVAQAIPVTKA